jgi:hypothetical protein
LGLLKKELLELSSRLLECHLSFLTRRMSKETAQCAVNNATGLADEMLPKDTLRTSTEKLKRAPTGLPQGSHRGLPQLTEGSHKKLS